MKHEHFKLIGIPSVSNPSSAELDEFLNQGHITPKSISIVKAGTFKMPGAKILIGYVPSKSEQKFKLVYKNIGICDDLAGAVETEAATHKGVICQHVGLDEFGIMSVVFLVHE